MNDVLNDVSISHYLINVNIILLLAVDNVYDCFSNLE
jgi:hypothetical protein